LYVGRETGRFHWNGFDEILIRYLISKRLVFMNCLSCGEVCDCSPEPDLSAQRPSAAESAAESAVESDSPAVALEAASAPAWRDEVSARLVRYRARRKVRPPRYPSLSLRFESPASPDTTGGSLQLPVFEPVSNQALALDEMTGEYSAIAETDIEFRDTPPVLGTRQPAHPPTGQPSEDPSENYSAYRSGKAAAHVSSHPTAKIIEFPRSAWAPPPPPPDQLAEPVSERPRILEVPEVAPSPPALGGITIEASTHPDAERRPGIDFPLESAALGVRLVAALVDALIVAAASGIFALIFWKVAAVRPPLAQILGLAAGIPCLFWVAYQYLLIVYAASTPGLRIAGLELARFDGASTSRSSRRWRVLGTCLSGLSLGMGYAWVFLDEDALCWHDRITHTYLSPRKRAVTPQSR
jgi:uncharacterized RDD family membrane protein YckC